MKKIEWSRMLLSSSPWATHNESLWSKHNVISSSYSEDLRFGNAYVKIAPESIERSMPDLIVPDFRTEGRINVLFVGSAYSPRREVLRLSPYLQQSWNQFLGKFIETVVWNRAKVTEPNYYGKLEHICDALNCTDSCAITDCVRMPLALFLNGKPKGGDKAIRTSAQTQEHYLMLAKRSFKQTLNLMPLSKEGFTLALGELAFISLVACAWHEHFQVFTACCPNNWPTSWF